MMVPTIEESWDAALQHEFAQTYFSVLMDKVHNAYQTSTVYPPQDTLFRAFSLCPLTATTVVILGQDPYHGPNQAHGLSFSVPDGLSLPPSLRNIYRELAADTATVMRTSGDLTTWAKQGVLLLNSHLTVEGGNPASHESLGWEQFTDAVIKIVSTTTVHTVFMLWGAHAIKKQTLIDTTKHCVLTAPHPSPLSAYRGFFGCRHFSTCNRYLQLHNKVPINWQL
jgi:uracil-DNA glycosylase